MDKYKLVEKALQSLSLFQYNLNFCDRDFSKAFYIPQRALINFITSILLCLIRIMQYLFMVHYGIRTLHVFFT